MKIIKRFNQRKYIEINKVDDEYILSITYYQDVPENLISEIERTLAVYADIFTAFINSLPIETTPEQYEDITLSFKRIIQKYDVKVVQVDTKPVKPNLGQVFVTYIAMGRISILGNNCYVFQPVLEDYI